MRRRRHRGETKVWHDPNMTDAGRRKEQAAQPSETEEQRRANRSRRKVESGRRAGARIVGGPTGTTDPKELERERLLDRLLRVEGRPSITNAADAFLEAGFEFPKAQQVWLQLLEHKDEERVAEAIEQLTSLLGEEPPERRAVLESRLRRIEEYADEASTRDAAASLRRMLSTTKAAPSTPPA
jgi:hypothetical protein